MVRDLLREPWTAQFRWLDGKRRALEAERIS
jgi:hypothetical protein